MTALLIDGVGHEREINIYGHIPELRLPVPLPFSVAASTEPPQRIEMEAVTFRPTNEYRWRLHDWGFEAVQIWRQHR